MRVTTIHFSLSTTHAKCIIIRNVVILYYYRHRHWALCARCVHSCLTGMKASSVSPTTRRSQTACSTRSSTPASTPTFAEVTVTTSVTPTRLFSYVMSSSLQCFWATVCKTVRPMLSVRCLSCLSCLSVCNVRALWPNGWTDQDETWHAGRPRPWPHCVRWDPATPPPKGHSPTQFSAHICCGQMAAWIKMPLGMELGLSPGDFVLNGDPSLPSPKRGQSPLPNFRPISIVAKRLHAS